MGFNINKNGNNTKKFGGMVLNRRYDKKLKLWYIPPHPLDNLGVRKYIMPNQPMGLVIIKEGEKK